MADFRDDAVRESLRLLSDSPLDCALDSPQSLCLPINPGLKLPLYRIAVVPWLSLFPGLLLLLFAPIYALLILTPWVDATLHTLFICVGSLVAAIALIYFSYRFGPGNTRAVFASTLGPRVGELEQHVAERCTFCVEDPATYKKQKVISEDYATGGPDGVRPGLLMEGVCYRYIIRPADVTEVLSDGKNLIVTCRVGDVLFKVSLVIILDDEASDEQREERARQIVRDLLSSHHSAGVS